MTTLATHFRAAVQANPDSIALIADGQSFTFREVDELSDCYATGMAGLDIEQGTRIAFMIPPGLDFFALCYAVFKLGAVPILIDGGMDMTNLALCLDRAEPEVFIGIPLAQQGRVHFGWAQRTLRLSVTAGEVGDWGGPTLDELPRAVAPFPPAEIPAGEPAMILYTTGSTGPAKGAIFTHAMCNAQFEIIGDLFGMRPGGVDMPTLPTIAPFTVAAGMTSVIPDMDFTRPGEVNAGRLVEQINEHRVTSMFGSPALMDRLGRYGAEHGVTLPSLQRVLTAAAPVAPQVLERLVEMLTDDAKVVVFYGSTEALPVAVIDAREILNETAAAWAAGAGTCVGKPLKTIKTAVIQISDEPRPEWDPAIVLPPGETGELAVSGTVVSAEYCAQPRANALAKIGDSLTGEIWHRMGDVVRMDARGRLWFQGRTGHRVQTSAGTLFTEPVEAVFNQHPHVKRTALVGVGEPGSQLPVLCVEMEEEHEGSQTVREELLDLGRAHPHTAAIEDIRFHDGFPVDIRHNSKIFREKLAVWASEHATPSPASA